MAAPSYLDRHGVPGELGDLDRHRVLTWTGSGRGADRIPLLRGGTHAVSAALSSTSVELRRRMAARGEGIALAPDGELAGEPVDADALVPVLDELVGCVTPVSLSVPRRVLDMEPLRPLIELVRGVAASV